jgi:hypothetical protein
MIRITISVYRTLRRLWGLIANLVVTYAARLDGIRFVLSEPVEALPRLCR